MKFFTSIFTAHCMKQHLGFLYTNNVDGLAKMKIPYRPRFYIESEEQSGRRPEGFLYTVM